jgi:hypothetical protein
VPVLYRNGNQIPIPGQMEEVVRGGEAESGSKEHGQGEGLKEV